MGCFEILDHAMHGPIFGSLEMSRGSRDMANFGGSAVRRFGGSAVCHDTAHLLQVVILPIRPTQRLLAQGKVQVLDSDFDRLSTRTPSGGLKGECWVASRTTCPAKTSSLILR